MFNKEEGNTYSYKNNMLNIEANINLKIIIN